MRDTKHSPLVLSLDYVNVMPAGDGDGFTVRLGEHDEDEHNNTLVHFEMTYPRWEALKAYVDSRLKEIQASRG